MDRKTGFRVAAGLLVALAAGAAYWLTPQEEGLPPGFAIANGRIEAERADVATKFSGRPAEILVDEGDRVEADQVLARLDDTQLRAQLRADLEDYARSAPRAGCVQYRLAETGEVLAAGARVLTLLDLTDVVMTVYLPTAAAGRLSYGAEARLVLDAAPEYVIPASVSFVAGEAQFTPKYVETEEERENLMFRVKLRIPPEILADYQDVVKTGVPGVAHVRVDPSAEWPGSLAVGCPMTAEAITAELAHVSHRYGKITALDDVSLSLPEGRMVGLIGPDGVGRSTLLGLMAGVRRIQQGRVAVLGGDMGDATHCAASYPRIAYMPQGLGRNLYPTLSVHENVDFFGRLFGQGPAERAERIRELLDSTGLAPFAGRPAGKLSGGMKQKLSLCCALIHDPGLLILDEPTTGVDPLSRKQFWDLIDRIRARRKAMTLIVATAYMSEAERFDEVIAMNAGRIPASGAPQDLHAQAGADTLQEAFIAFLPEKQRAGHGAVHLPPPDRSPRHHRAPVSLQPEL